MIGVRMRRAWRMGTLGRSTLGTAATSGRGGNGIALRGPTGGACRSGATDRLGTFVTLWFPSG